MESPTLSRADAFPVEGKGLSWSALDRAMALDQAETRSFAMIIIGGGITGAGIAREAALRRIPFLLVDKGDFASGTSSRSSKLIHGGLRYLAQGDLGLMRESVTERDWLHQALPHLVRPLPFHWCSYAGGADGPAKIRAGLLVYDLLANGFSRTRSPGRHRILSPEELLAREPAARSEGLRMAGLYYDTQVDDARLTLETLKEARNRSGGLSVVLNYVQAERIVLEGGRVRGVALRDGPSGRLLQVAAGCVVNATGAWTDETLGRAGEHAHLIRPTKGVHLVVPNHRLGNRGAFVLRAVDDGRFFFVLRRGEVSLIGTTDTDYDGSLDAPRCTRQDCDYLLRGVNAAFPAAHLTPEDLLGTYAGVRPLVLAGGGSASEESRKHVIRDPGTGLVTIAGGKLTTFRVMAWDLLERCARRGYIRHLRGAEARGEHSRRPYQVGLAWEALAQALRRLCLEDLVPDATLRHLHQQYGQGALSILREVRLCPGSGEPLVAGHPYCAAEIHHLLAFEDAPRLTDVMLRRTEMGLEVSHRRQGELAGRVAELMGRRYGWSEARVQEELGSHLDGVRASVAL